MANRPDDRLTEAKMDADNLYLEEIFTDRRVGTIRRLTPVNGKGAIDTTRAVAYIGETQVMTSVGALPISFEIEAKDAIERTVRDLQEMRRQAASSIVVPQGGMGGMGGLGGMGGGGMPGGGKIQMP